MHLGDLLVLTTAAFLVAIPITVFGTYGTLLLCYRKGTCREKHERDDESIKYEPCVSVVLPTHNEEEVIAKRIENLLESTYPREKTEIIVVDDSTDSTPEIVRDYMKKIPQIQLIRSCERIGYSRSLIAGCDAAHGEIVVLSEASSLMDRSAIPLLVNDFRDPRIGVVTGKSIILNLDEEMGRSEAAYLRILDFVRRAESNMHSTVYMKGEAAAVRKDLIRDLRDLDDCPGTADTGIALHVAKMGHRSIYDNRVRFYEYAPSTRRERTHQKTTRAANLIKIIWKFRGMFLRSRYGKLGLVILPMNFLMLTLAPISLFLGLLSLCLLSLVDPGASYPIWVIVGSATLVGLLFSRRIILTLVEFEYSLLKAIYEVVALRRVHDMIEKIGSTRRIGHEQPISNTANHGTK